jgi:hypothetical protein
MPANLKTVKYAIWTSSDVNGVFPGLEETPLPGMKRCEGEIYGMILANYPY